MNDKQFEKKEQNVINVATLVQITEFKCAINNIFDKFVVPQTNKTSKKWKNIN